MGGWLLATHAFNLERRERLLAGFGIGLFIYLWIVNLFGHWLNPYLAFIISAILVLVIGLFFALRGARPILDFRDFGAWQLILSGLIMAFVFTQIGKGLGLFDEHKNLSIISTMASGDIPPHFYMNPDFYLPYHYGFQLLGSSLMKLGGLFPWSAFDLSKGIIGAYAVLLAYLLGVRHIKTSMGGIVLAAVVTFTTGTRYLLMVIPPAILVKASEYVELVHTSSKMGGEFYESLASSWVIDGGPPIPFVFGFLNGIFQPHIYSLQAGPPAVNLALLFLVWLLVSRSANRLSFIPLGLILAYWALSFESSYVLISAGAGLAALYYLWKRRYNLIFTVEYYALLLSAPLAILQGGSITEMFRSQFLGYERPIPAALKTASKVGGFLGFSFRWPPVVLSAHVSPLDITSPYELMVGIFELGPIVLLAPWITYWTWKRFKQGEWISGVLTFGSWVGFLIPIFFLYRSERDVTRLTSFALIVWSIYLVFMIWEYSGTGARFLKFVGVSCLALMVFGGLVTAGITLTAAAEPKISYHMSVMDAQVAGDVWGKLPEDGVIFDPNRWKAAAVTGMVARTGVSLKKNLPEWDELHDDPSLQAFLDQGYDYVYINDGWWNGLSEEEKEVFSNPCVKVLSEHWNDDHDYFRRLVSLEDCYLK